MNDSINILIVEDDENINRLLCNIISQSGYHPKAAYSGTEAMIYLETQEWDMVLLDLMLPGLTGEELITKIREKSTTPIIVISAKLETQTKIEALRAGADDYITKPFEIEEVSARIDACLRRYQSVTDQPSTKQFHHKDLMLDTDGKRVFVNDQEIKLTAIEYEILFLLMSHPKKVFTKANLFESIWKGEFYGDDNALTVHMSRVRTKLAKANPNEEYIETIWGMGYKLKS